jgi:hypothetical protein
LVAPVGHGAALSRDVLVALLRVLGVDVGGHVAQLQAIGLHCFHEGLNLAAELLVARGHLAPVALLLAVEVVGLGHHATLRAHRVDSLLPAVVAVLQRLLRLRNKTELGQLVAIAGEG